MEHNHNHHSWSSEETADINATSLRMLYAGMCSYGRVLDLGANKGHLIPLLHFGPEVTEYTAIEGSKELLEKTERLFKKTYGSKTNDSETSMPGHFHHLDFEHQPLPCQDEHFDFIFMGEVLEHLQDDPLFVLKQAYRVLKPEGTFMLTTPLQVKKDEVATGSGHAREYTELECARLLKSAGFQVLGLYMVSQNHVNYRRMLMVFESSKPY